VPYDTRGTLRVVLSTPATDDVEILKFMPCDVFSVKLLLGGVVKAYYDMATGTVDDLSGNNNHAVLTLGTWKSNSTDYFTMDDVDDTITLGSPMNIGNVFRFKTVFRFSSSMASATGWRTIFSNASWTAGKGYMMNWEGNSKALTFYSRTGGLATLSYPITTPSTTNFYTVEVISNGTTIDMYVDNVKVATNTYASATMSSNASTNNVLVNGTYNNDGTYNATSRSGFDIKSLLIENNGVALADYDFTTGTIVNRANNGIGFSLTGRNINDLIYGYVTEVVKGTNTYVDSTIVQKATYKYKLTTVDTSGNESDGTIITLTTPDTTAPTNVTDLAGTALKTGVYLQMDGVDDYLKTPLMAYDEVIMDIKPRQVNNTWYFDARPTNTGNYLTRSSSGTEITAGAGTLANIYWNGIKGTNITTYIPYDTRGILRIVSTTQYTEDLNFFSTYIGSSCMAGDIYSIKVLLGGVVKAYYDMSTGTVFDLSGNGNHGVLNGGTFITPKYLQMNGTSDSIKTPTLTFDKVEMDIYAEFNNNAGVWQYFLDSRTGVANGWFAHLNNYENWGAGISSILVDGVQFNQSSNISRVPSSKRTLLTVNFSTAVTDDVSLFSFNTNASDFLKGRIYGVKFWNGSTLVASYDMKLGTVNDQSGNGKHATLYGGTWIDSFTSAVALTWTPPLNADFTKVKVYRDNIFVNETPKGFNTTAVYNLESNKTYVFKVSAVDDVGNESTPTTSLSITTPDVIPPNEATILSDIKTTNSVTINWTNPATDFSKAVIYRKRILTNPKYYLQLNGNSDYIVPPNISGVSKIEFDMISEIPVGAVGSFDYFVNNFAQNSLYRINDTTYNYGSNYSDVKVNGVTVTNNTSFVPQNQRITLTATLSSVIGTGGSAWMFSGYSAGAPYTKAKVYSIKYFNTSGGLICSYDMTKGNLLAGKIQDQSGNNNHATLIGGAWMEEDPEIKVTELNSGETSYTDTGVLPNTTYRYRIATVDSAGNNSLGILDTVLTNPVPPTVIVGVTQSSSRISWQITDINISEYRIYQLNTQTGQFNIIGRVRNESGNWNTYLETDLTTPIKTNSTSVFSENALIPNTMYTIKASAYNGVESVQSSAFQATTTSIPTMRTLSGTKNGINNLTWTIS
jgi:chitodextrinase